MLGYIKKITLDTLFPIECLACQKNGRWICDGCLAKINLIEIQVCPYCEKAASVAGRICPDCQRRRRDKNKLIGLDNLIVATSYQKPLIQKMIHVFKYNFAHELGEPLGKILVKVLLASALPLPDIIIPVPLHKRRLRWRGFNQAEILARYISLNLLPGLPIEIDTDLLRRRKMTRSQMSIRNYSQRKKNLIGAFEAEKNGRSSLKNKSVLLVDDVCTTGSTLFECAETLKGLGARQVLSVVIARQEIAPQ